MQLIGLLVLLTTSGAHAAQFRVTQQSLSAARSHLCSASWGDVALFAGGNPSGQVADIFDSGIHTGVADLFLPRIYCVAASASPGVIAVSNLLTIEFFDVSARAFHPFNSSLKLSGGVDSGVGALTADVLAFAVSGGIVDVVSSTTRSVMGSVSVGSNSPTTVRISDSGGTEYLLFIAGRDVSSGVPLATVAVLPASSPTIPVTPTSQLQHARSSPTCATTTMNVVVCVGGKDGNGNTVDEADVCTIDTSGVVSCTSKTYLATSVSRVVVLLAMFVAFLPRRYVKEELTVSDANTMEEIVLEELPWSSHGGYNSVGAGRFAYFAGGSLLLGGSNQLYLDNVTVIECLPPCLPPLVAASSATTTAGTTTAKTTGTRASGGTSLSVSVGMLMGAAMVV